MSTTLTNGIIIPENGSRNWGGDLANNWNILDINVGYMTDVKNRVTTLENSVAENTANIQINTSNISALQTSKQDKIEDLETIRAGANAGATAVQPSTLTDSLATKANDSDVVHKSGNETISGLKTFTNRMFLKSSTFERGNLPSKNVTEDREFELLDKNDRRIFSIFNYYYTNSNGKSVMYAYNPNTTDYENIGISFLFDNINSQKSFAPYDDGVYNLGYSTNKWKTLNGINPGGLSLPNPSPSVFISKALPSSGGTITADVDCWFEIRTKATSPNALIQLFVAGGSSTYAKNTGDNLIISVPMRAGISVTIFYKDIETPSVCRLVPCVGNV